MAFADEMFYKRNMSGRILFFAFLSGCLLGSIPKVGPKAWNDTPHASTSVPLTRLFLPPSGGEVKSPGEWWEIELLIRSEGTYILRKTQDSASGTYRYKIRWTGSMERDEEDFLIYHENWRLLEWDIKEEDVRSGSQNIFTTKDFSAKPEFDFQYFLKRGNHVCVAFQVLGISVPCVDFPEKFKLLMASTREGPAFPKHSEYSAFLERGSNSILLDPKEVGSEQTRKHYRWNWKRQKWHPSKSGMIFFSHEHDVDVEIAIIPHASR